jgi:hypothetical protein
MIRGNNQLNNKDPALTWHSEVKVGLVGGTAHELLALRVELEPPAVVVLPKGVPLPVLFAVLAPPATRTSLDQSGGRLRNILRASTNQTVDWRRYSGPRPIRWRGREYTQGLDQSGGGAENILRALTNQVGERGIYSGTFPRPPHRFPGDHTLSFFF